METRDHQLEFLYDPTHNTILPLLADNQAFHSPRQYHRLCDSPLIIITYHRLLLQHFPFQDTQTVPLKTKLRENGLSFTTQRRFKVILPYNLNSCLKCMATKEGAAGGNSEVHFDRSSSLLNWSELSKTFRQKSASTAKKCGAPATFSPWVNRHGGMNSPAGPSIWGPRREVTFKRELVLSSLPVFSLLPVLPGTEGKGQLEQL